MRLEPLFGKAGNANSAAPNAVIGRGVPRVEGRLKVTGTARYSAEHPLPGLVHAVLVGSTVARGRVAGIETAAALAVPGVLAVLTHENAPRLQPVRFPQAGQPRASAGHSPAPLQDDAIHFGGQTVAVVVAETSEAARHAAGSVRVNYEETEPPATRLDAPLGESFALETDPYGEPLQYRRGDPDKAFTKAGVRRIEAAYRTAANHHNPIGPFATTAHWEDHGERLTVHDATQWPHNVRMVLATTLGVPAANVRVLAPFVGGAFGCGLRCWPHVVLAAVAARHVNRPVRLVLTRAEMFTGVGFRPPTRQTVRLAATKRGRLTAIVHENLSPTSAFDEFVESTTNNSRALYACPNVATTHRLVRLNVPTPTYMRGPGESVGTFALECAMDELAHALGLDPIELRLQNDAPKRDPQTGRPWSSRSLAECFRVGAERFVWERRRASPAPRSLRGEDGRTLVGLGVASAMYPANRLPASAAARISADGTATVQSAATDIGPGTYTAMTQIAAETLGLPMDRVRFELGDTRMPNAPLQGGSMLLASLGSAVQAACQALREKIIGLAATDPDSPLYRANPADVEVADGRAFLRAEPGKGQLYAEILAAKQMFVVEAQADSLPGAEAGKFAMFGFGAQFCEVHADPDLGRLRVARFLGVYGVGRIINARTAHSQMVGGIIGGIGQALLEETVMDEHNGRLVNASLGDYHVPVQADVGEIEAVFVEETDPHVNPLGAKGIGEIGIVGAAAAVANAVFHATGVRARELPITLDKVFPFMPLKQ